MEIGVGLESLERGSLRRSSYLYSFGFLRRGLLPVTPPSELEGAILCRRSLTLDR